jgi:hypothetical protein
MPAGRRKEEGGRSVRLFLLMTASFLLPLSSFLQAQERLDRGRFAFHYSARDRQLAATLASQSIASDTFPGLPRPTQRVMITIARDRDHFRDLVGTATPDWGSAVAFPDSRSIVLQGQRAGSDAGDPTEVLRHELAHLALHEFLGNLPPRWFDEGYASLAAGEWGRQDVLTTNLALALGGMPTLEQLDELFGGGTTAAQSAYALAYSAVAEMARIDGARGLTLFFGYWRRAGKLDVALRQSFGMTLADFEQRWRLRTRRRYGGLALVSNVALAALVLLFVLTPFYLARRRRDRLRLEKMREADAAAEKAEAAAIDDLLGGP